MKSKPNKKQALEALKSTGSPKQRFNRLLELFMKHPNKPPGPARHYNAAGFSKQRLISLEYDVQKLFGISRKELLTYKPSPQEPGKQKAAVKSNEQILLDMDPDAPIEELRLLAIANPEISEIHNFPVPKVPTWPKGIAGNAARKNWVKEHAPQETVPRKNADLDLLIEETVHRLTTQAQDNGVQGLLAARASLIEHKHTVVASSMEQAPDDAKAGFKIREQYPFLSEDDCPDELKVLVADKITAYHKMLQGRAELKEAIEGDNTQLYAIASEVVEKFELNHQIAKELDHYAEHKEILGDHPIFEDLNLQREVSLLKLAELVTTRNTLRTYVSKEKKKTFKSDRGKLASAAKVELWEKKIALINARIEE